MLQYVQVEPRELVELYSSNDHAKFVQHCYETRTEMATNIEARDKKTASAQVPKIKYVEENDWWAKNEMRPQAIIDVMMREGIKDVNNFLLWISEYEPDATMNSFVFHRDQKRLEQQINMCVCHYWYLKPFMQHMEGRRRQYEAKEK